MKDVIRYYLAIDTMSTGDKLQFNLTIIAGTHGTVNLIRNDTINIFQARAMI